MLLLNLSAFQESTVEDLLALLDHDAFAGELVGGDGKADVLDLLTGNLHAALLDQTAGLPLGGHQAALEHQLQDADGAVGEVRGGKAGGGHIGGVAALGEEAPGSLLSLFASSSPWTRLVSS